MVRSGAIKIACSLYSDHILRDWDTTFWISPVIVNQTELSDSQLFVTYESVLKPK